MAKNSAKKTVSSIYGNYSTSISSRFKKIDIVPGDMILIEMKTRRIEGNLIVQSDMGDPDTILIKLDNGYNVGIKLDETADIIKLEGKVEFESFPTRIPKQKKGLPQLSLLSTGGTIASRIDYQTGGVVMAMEPAEIFASLPELFEEVTFNKVKSLFNMASEDVGPEQWIRMADAVAEEVNSGARGVILSHGTDTMGYSAAALSFMLPNLPTPVLFTGAQRSTDRGSFDGAFNLISSARIAANADLAGVYVVMHENSDDDYCQVSRGTRVRKMHTTRRDAFKTINEQPIARIDNDGRIEELHPHINRRTTGSVEPMLGFEEKTALVKIFPGISPDIIDHYVDNNYRGIIIEGTGLGHVPTFPPDEENRNIMNGLSRALDEDIYIGMTSQCLNGRVHPYVYRATRTASSLGVQYLEDMIPETAYVKLGWALGNYYDVEKVKEIMLTNLADEISDRSYYKEYQL